MSAVPRPIPIVIGNPRDDAYVSVHLRVLERGHEDLHVNYIIGGSYGTSWREHLTYALDKLINLARREVGVRHGTWICHVLPMGWHTDMMPPHPPPVAPTIRHREPPRWRTIRYEGPVSVTPQVLEQHGVPY